MPASPNRAPRTGGRKGGAPGPKAVGYIRVSTQDQAREGWSLDAQRRRIQAFCEAKGWPLDEVYADEGVSAVKHRPAWEKLLANVLADGVTHVVALKLDRFGRSALDLLETYKAFENKGVALVVVDDAIDTSTPAGRLMRTVLAAIAEFERDIISERTKAALVEAKAQGRQLGRPALVPDDVESLVLRYSQDGMTLRAITARLNEDGVPTVRGKPWHPASVDRVLKRARRRGNRLTEVE